MTKLEQRILEISYRYKLSHIGSCLTAVGIIDDIYKLRRAGEPFILSCGHAHLAHAVVMEEYYKGFDAEKNITEHGIHCERGGGCDVSTGSLGHGIGIALGMAIANRMRNVWCLVSDGELTEGSVYEALNNKVSNLKVYCNYNGWCAYDDIQLSPIFKAYGVEVVDTRQHWFIIKYGQEAHYKVLNQSEYEENILH